MNVVAKKMTRTSVGLKLSVKLADVLSILG